MKNKKNKGITLIALIITIIVMLILVAVTIQVVISSGLLSSASKAGKDYQAAAEEEATMNKINIAGKEYNSIEEYVGTKPETPEEPEAGPPKVGDYVNYTPETKTYKVGSDATGYIGTDAPNPQVFTTQTGENALKWRILSIDESTGEMELVSKTQTTDKMYFTGATGYNHCVDILNDMCKDLYSNSLIGAEARSISIEDIQAKTTYDFNSYTFSDGRKYAKTKYQMTTYSANWRKRPNLYIQELGSTSAGLNATGLKGESEGLNNRTKNGDISKYTDATIDANSGYANASSSTYATYTHVNYTPESYLRTDLEVNNPTAGIFNTETTYWLASRCVHAGSTYAYFDLRCVNPSGSVDVLRFVHFWWRRRQSRLCCETYSISTIHSQSNSSKCGPNNWIYYMEYLERLT